MKRGLVLGVLVAVGAFSMAVAAYQAPAAPKVIDLEKLRDNLYVATSSSPGNRDTFSGGNVAIFITDDGVTLVDTKLAGWGPALLEDIKKVTNKPVTRIINTHTHGDHTGNDNFFGATVDIVAQANTKANMTRMDAFKGDNAQYLPKRTFTDQMTLGSGKDRIELRYFGAGHTNGDAFVIFPALRVLHTGDMFAWKDGPFCDRANGGSCVAWPKTLAKVLASIKNIDTVIPGHSPMMTMKDLDEYQRYTSDLLAETQKAMQGGKSVDEAAAAASAELARKYPGYKSERVKAAVQAIYDELKATH